MTYNVFGVMLNPTLILPYQVLNHEAAYKVDCSQLYKTLINSEQE